jgi:hypothetical protein
VPRLLVKLYSLGDEDDSVVVFSMIFAVFPTIAVYSHLGPYLDKILPH